MRRRTHTLMSFAVLLATTTGIAADAEDVTLRIESVTAKYMQTGEPRASTFFVKKGKCSPYLELTLTLTNARRRHEYS